MARIPKNLHPYIDAAWPDHVCLVGTVLPDGYAQITPRGSVMVFDDETLALWDRGGGSTAAYLKDGTKMTVYFRNRTLVGKTEYPKGGVARFYGTAAIHKSGPAYEKVWEKLIDSEKKSDPEKKGTAILIKLERAEDLDRKPLAG